MLNLDRRQTSFGHFMGTPVIASEAVRKALGLLTEDSIGEPSVAISGLRKSEIASA